MTTVTGIARGHREWPNLPATTTARTTAPEAAICVWTPYSATTWCCSAASRSPYSARHPLEKVVAAFLTDARGQEIAQSENHANGDGTFMLTLPALPAGGPLALRVRCGADELVFHDVMVGEVWLAGGQSNHRVRVAQQRIRQGGRRPDAHDPLLRFYNTPKSARVNLATESASGWRPAEAPQVAHMTPPLLLRQAAARRAGERHCGRRRGLLHRRHVDQRMDERASAGANRARA